MHEINDNIHALPRSAPKSPSSGSPEKQFAGAPETKNDEASTKSEQNPKLESVSEWLRSRRLERKDAVAQQQHRNVDDGPVDADALFSRYNNIVKRMVVADSSRLELVQENERRPSQAWWLLYSLRYVNENKGV
ncbi:hypothetical protein ACA910_005925 [Epithemia clementina (nom. ined.)]